MPWLEPVVLEGDRLRLEPFDEGHLQRLVSETDPDTFRYFTSAPKDWSPDGFRTWIETRTTAPNLTLVFVDKASERVVGSSCFFDVREEHRALEIGYTWIAREMRGTWVNPEAKLLMVGHAFETLGAVRVQIKCDARNAQSRAAILKLGAQFEGVLRNYAILANGHHRDTAFHSILPGEWAQVRAGLVERLKSFS